MSNCDNTRPVLTVSQAAAAEARFRQLVQEHERRRAAAGIGSTAVDYWVYRGLFAAAYGAEAVTVIPDTNSDTENANGKF